MGSEPHGCNSRCFCVQGICGSVAQNPQDKDGRYNAWEESNHLKFQFSIIYENKTECLIGKKKRNVRFLKKNKEKKQKTFPSQQLPVSSRCHVLHSADQSEIKTDW